MTRTLFVAVAVFSIIFTPYWIYGPFLLLGFILFSFFWEAIILGFLIDVLYGVGLEQGQNIFSFPFAIGLTLLVIIVFPLRERLRVNA